MDRLRVWMEARSDVQNNNNEIGGCNNSNHHQQHGSNSSSNNNNKVMGSRVYRPPPLCTLQTSNYLAPCCDMVHDDGAFQQMALNLLSRHGALGITPMEAIQMTLTQPAERANFWEGLQVRKCRAYNCKEQQYQEQLSPAALSLLDTLDRTFSQDLQKLVEAESSVLLQNNNNNNNNNNNSKHYSLKTQRHSGVSCLNSCRNMQPPPFTPRNVQLSSSSTASSTSSTSTSSRNSHTHNRSSSSNKNQNIYHSSSSSSSSSQQAAPKKRKTRRFFPDCDSVFLMRSRGARVQNIDWKLAEAISQVQTLRLDGDSTTTNTTATGSAEHYEPPAMFSSGGGNSY